MTLVDYLADNDETQSAFGDRIGLPQGTIARYVNGKRMPRPEIMARIVKATNGRVSASDFYPAVDHSVSGPSAPPAMSNHRKETGSCPTDLRPRAAVLRPQAAE